MKVRKVSRTPRQTQTIRRMVITAMMAAITALFVFTPVGMIPLPPPLPAVTLTHIPVIVAALAEGPLVGVSTGLFFGLFSLIRAWNDPNAAISLTQFFRDPLVSVVPRLIIPLTAFAVYALWRKLFKKRGTADKVGAGLAAAVGALTNTVLCLGAIVLLYGAPLNQLVNGVISLGKLGAEYQNQAAAWLVAVVGLPNGLLEMGIAAILVPMVLTAVNAMNRHGVRRSQSTRQPAQAGREPKADNAAMQTRQSDALGGAEPDNAAPLQEQPTANSTENPPAQPEEDGRDTAPDGAADDMALQAGKPKPEE